MTKKPKEHAENEQAQEMNTEHNSEKVTGGKEKQQYKDGSPKSDNQAEKPGKKQSEDHLEKESRKIHALKADLQEEKNKLTAAEENARDWQDKYIRLAAEFDNYRKRTIKEKTELIKQANGELLKDMLPIIDDFERGLVTIEKTEDVEGMKKGVSLIYTKFAEFIRQNGLKEIEAKNKEFDIDFHEALTKIPAPDESLKGKVVDVIEKGYILNDRVIRYAKVVVGE
jgi:molecular chaperone GrpE